MKILLCTLLLTGSVLLAQDAGNQKDSKGQITVRGCVSRAGGDYILIRQDPAVTYELQSSHKIKIGHYLGQHVEVTGGQSPTMATSSDAGRRDASPVTLTVTSIRTIDKECPSHEVSAQ